MDASLRSSILEYRRENGRTYHRLSDGKYLVPNDETEQDRLDIANHLWMLAWEGKYCICPKNEGARRVLDIGTGTGIWAIDYADSHPEATVLGVDLSPIQPAYVPINCSFEIDDLEKEWLFTELFDFIFARNMAGSFRDWDDVAEQAFNHLEPGGYFEIHDNLYPLQCDDGTLREDSALFQWSKYLVQASERTGRSITIASELPGILEAAGFVDVTVTRQVMPVSPWPADPRLKELGHWTQESLRPGIEGLCLALFTRMLGWTSEQVRVFCVQVREDARNLEDVSRLFGQPQTYPVRRYSEEPPEPHAPKFIVEAPDLLSYSSNLLSKSICIIDFDHSFTTDSAPAKLGIPAKYFAPKVAVPEHASVASDVWALGCAIFRVRSGDDDFFDYDINCPADVLRQIVKTIGGLLKKWKGTRFAEDGN
ncbi:methyltransferase domain-containing protein [Colletotrichum orchidophilum]|uniref:Methyltransferase domain-containing protein n=1 Tax=Colletotrichum orchidophilum TaxID=1209926 RepID=A0A1G4BP64_9PEZI|nr:methyltransferase domain-containing protein [Colletotrichum orchidophilum]OHF03252.1 methyltransferase domain-containing protein [Colletotrichum orchidophilum]